MTAARTHLLAHSIGAVAGLALAAVILLCSPHGIGMSRDSVAYLRFARVLTGQEGTQLDGQTQVFLTHYPPGLPLLIAAAGAAPVSGAIVNALCAVATLVVASRVVFLHTGSILRTGVAVVILATSPAFVPQHLWLAAEPPFLLATTVLIAVLLRFHARPVYGNAIYIGLALVAAALIRYVGLAFIPAAMLSMLLVSAPVRDRLKFSMIAATLAVLPVLILAIIHLSLGSTPGHRAIELHAITSEHLQSLMRSTIGLLCSPKRFPNLYWVGGAVLLIGLCLLLVRSSILRVALPLIGFYLGLLLVSVAALDNATPIDERLLSPVALAAALLLVIGVGIPESRIKRIAATTLITAALVSAISGSVNRIAIDLNAARQFGLGFTHAVYRDSPLVAACADLPAKSLIYSNYPEAIYLYSRQDAQILPGVPTGIGRAGDRPIEQQVAQMREKLQKANGYVAYFNFRAGKSLALTPIPLDTIRAEIPTRSVATPPDGVLLQAE